MTTATAAAAAGPLSSDHINYLILRYLQEYGHEASATAFYRDWRRSAEYHNPEDLPFAHSVRRNELVSVIQDGLYHDELISSVRKEGRRFNFTTNGAPASGSRPGTAGKGKGRIEQVRRGTEDFPTPPPKRQRKSEEAPQQERQVNGAAEAMDVDAGSPSAGDAEEDAEAASPAVQTPEPEIIEVPERYDSMDVAVQTEGKTGPKTSTMYWRTPRPDASLMHGTFSPAKSDRMLFTAGDGASQLYHMPSDFESGADQIISVDVGGVATGSIVTACAWDPQGHTLAYAVDFKRDIGVGGKQEKRQDISSLDSRTGQAAQYGSPTLLEPPGLVMALRYSWDGSQLLAVRTNGSRGSVEVWDVESGSRAKPANAISARAWWMFESRAIDAAWVSPTDFTVCGDDGLLQRFHVTGSESQGEGNMDVQAPGRRGLENVTSPSIPPEAQHLSFVKIRAEPPSNHDAAKGGINFVAMTSDGYTMVQAVASQTGSRFAQSSEASEPATALAVIRPCDRFKDFDEKSGETILATARDSGIFTINKLRPDSPLELSATCTLADDSSALALAWSPDSSYLAVCGVDIIQIWETLPLAYPSQRDHATRSLPPQPIVTWRRDKALASKGVRNGEHAANGQNEQDLEPSLTWSGDGESLALAVRNEVSYDLLADDWSVEANVLCRSQSFGSDHLSEGMERRPRMPSMDMVADRIRVRLTVDCNEYNTYGERFLIPDPFTAFFEQRVYLS